ncbi:MAG: hypothetical protein NT062_22095 [Proteobacteria bacterium]|nr:hypothetical protein [Pseudomonadota bacterium]
MASLVAVTALAACAQADAPAALDDRVVVLAGDLVVTDATVTAPRAGNEALRDHAAGDLIVARTGDGLLRSIVAIHDGDEGFLIDTAPATLGDAVIDGDVAAQLALSDGKADTYGLGRIDVDVGARTLWHNDRFTMTLNHAALHATPTLELDVSLRDRALDRFDAVLRGELDAALDVDIDARAGTVYPSIPLWTSAPAVFYQQIGWLPVVETVTLTVGVRFDTTARGDAHVRVQGAAHLALAGGIRYAAGDGFTPVAEFDHELTGALATGLRIDSIDVRAYLYTQVDVKFYGVAGPFVNVGPYVEKDRVGVHAEVGGALSAFGLSVPAIPRLTLFDASTPL